MRKNSGKAGTGVMSDAVLSKKLGHYQRMQRTWFAIGVIGVLCGVIAFFAVPDRAAKAILTAVLFGGGCFCAVILSERARKCGDALLQERLGDFFRTEFERLFGPELNTDALRIDEALMRMLAPTDGAWESCSVERFHAGTHDGAAFSAANVRLEHVYRVHKPQEGDETCRDEVFRGLVVRCRTHAPVSSALCVSARTENSPRGMQTGSEPFDSRFCVAADAGAVLTPQCMDFLLALDDGVEGRLCALRWEADILTLAFETDYGFAAVASGVDRHDLDAVRKSYISSLRTMAELLDRLRQIPLPI